MSVNALGGVVGDGAAGWRCLGALVLNGAPWRTAGSVAAGPNAPAADRRSLPALDSGFNGCGGLPEIQYCRHAPLRGP